MDYEKKYKDAMLVEQNAIIETMKAKVDLEKFICSYVKWNNIQDALKDQGLKCWNGEIVEIPQESEDERIKKEILDLVSISGNGNQFEEIKDWLEKQGEQPQGKTALEAAKEEKVDNQNCVKPVDKAEPKFKVKYAGNEYNVFETKDIAGVTFYGIEDEPNHIDYVKAENCEIISVYAIKENGSPYPTKPAVFSEKKPKRMISAEAKEAMYDKPACVWSEEDKQKINDIVYFLDTAKKHYASTVVLDACIDWLKSLKQRMEEQR